MHRYMHNAIIVYSFLSHGVYEDEVFYEVVDATLCYGAKVTASIQSSVQDLETTHWCLYARETPRTFAQLPLQASVCLCAIRRTNIVLLPSRQLPPCLLERIAKGHRFQVEDKARKQIQDALDTSK